MIFLDVWILQLDLRARVSAALAQVNRLESHPCRRITYSGVTVLGIVFILDQSSEKVAAVSRSRRSFANFVFGWLQLVLLGLGNYWLLNFAFVFYC